MENYVTYPNQKVINVHRETPQSDFLGIKNDNWMAASKDLTPHSMMLYFYFAANKNNYQFAFSPVAVNTQIGMAKSTCHDQFKNLVNKGYLVQRDNSNIYDFYERPTRTVIKEVCDSADSICCTAFEQGSSPENTEINNSTQSINKKPKTEQAQFSVSDESQKQADMLSFLLNEDQEKFVF